MEGRQNQEGWSGRREGWEESRLEAGLGERRDYFLNVSFSLSYSLSRFLPRSLSRLEAGLDERRVVVELDVLAELQAVGADEQGHVVVDAEGDDGAAALDERGGDLEARVAEDAHAADAERVRLGDGALGVEHGDDGRVEEAGEREDVAGGVDAAPADGDDEGVLRVAHALGEEAGQVDQLGLAGEVVVHALAGAAAAQRLLRRVDVRHLDVDGDGEVHGGGLCEGRRHRVAHEGYHLVRMSDRMRHIAASGSENLCLIYVLKITVTKMRGFLQTSQAENRHPILHSLYYSRCKMACSWTRRPQAASETIQTPHLRICRSSQRGIQFISHEHPFNIWMCTDRVYEWYNSS